MFNGNSTLKLGMQAIARHNSNPFKNYNATIDLHVATAIKKNE